MVYKNLQYKQFKKKDQVDIMHRGRKEMTVKHLKRYSTKHQ